MTEPVAAPTASTSTPSTSSTTSSIASLLTTDKVVKKKGSSNVSSLPPRETRQSAAASSLPKSLDPPPPAVPLEPAPPREPVWNPYLQQLAMKEFPPVDLQLQPDDAADEVLMLCARALTMCDNRALCPKEIAEVMMFRGWNCSGTQPFAIVSTCIRKHLQRRGFGITNASHGKPARPGLAPPLFASYELTGPPISLTAIGIDPNARPAVKRGTLWYLSEEGTGSPSPFGELDPNRHASNIPEPPKPKPVPIPRRQSAPPAVAKDFDYPPPPSAAPMRILRQDSPEDSLAMGRGKRKRKVSGIAGGDAAWHASSRPGLPPLEESDESQPSTPLACSLPEKSNIRRIRVRLGSIDSPFADGSTQDGPGPVLCPKVDTEDEMSDVEALQQRRFKKRSKSEGSLLSLTATLSRPTSPLQSQDRGLWSTFRSNGGHSASTSVASTDLRLERLEEEEDDAMDTDLQAPPPTLLPVPLRRTDEEQDDFHEAMLKGDFDFDFDFAIRRASVGSPDNYYDTPATTPRSWSGSVKDAIDADLYEQANVNHKTGVAADLVLETSGAAPNAADVTLSESKLSTSASSDSLAHAAGLSSPAPDLPMLPLESAAKTFGFAPAIGDPDEPVVSPRSVDNSRAPSLFSHRSFSPGSPFASPLASREPTPMSDTDSFDADLVVKSEPSPEYVFDSASPIPPFDDEDTFGQSYEEEVLEPFDIQNVDMAELDLVRWGCTSAPSTSSPSPKRESSGRKLRSGRTTGAQAGFLQAVFGSSSPSKEPPTPFGPEVFGFTTTPTLDWKPFCSAAASPEETFVEAQEISLDMIATVQETSQETVVPLERSSSPAEPEDVEMEDLPPPPVSAKQVAAASPSPQQPEPAILKTSMTQNAPAAKARKGKDVAVETRHSRRTSSRLSRK